MTNKYIFDTDVSSFLFKNDTRSEMYKHYLSNNLIALSFQTVAELYQWAVIHQWGELRRFRLYKWLRQFTIISYDDQVAHIWAEIRGERRKMGRPISAQDAWVASCTIRSDSQLVTHNRDDYVAISNLKIVD